MHVYGREEESDDGGVEDREEDGMCILVLHSTFNRLLMFSGN